MVDFFTSFMVSLPPIVAVLLVSLFASVVITIAYRFLTDQSRMKHLRTTLKESQKKMKEHQKKNNTKKMMQEQQVAMEANMEYMRHSMKPTLITMLPLLLIFGWMNANCGFYSLPPGETFSVFAVFEKEIGNATLEVPEGLVLQSNGTQAISRISLTEDAKKTIIDANSRMFGSVKKDSAFNMIIWKINPTKEGTFNLVFKHEGKTYTKEILISEARLYKDPAFVIGDAGKGENGALGLVMSNKPIYFFGIHWFSWLWLYIISSIIFGNILRKVMDIY